MRVLNIDIRKKFKKKQKRKKKSLSHVLEIKENSINKEEEDLSAKYSNYSFHMYSLLRNLVDFTERMLKLENRNIISIIEEINSPRTLCLTLTKSSMDVVLVETENFQIVGNNLLKVRLKVKKFRITEMTEEVIKERVILEHLVCMLNELISELNRNSLIEN